MMIFFLFLQLLGNQEVKVVAHEAVGVIAAVTATSVALVIWENAHPVEGVDELVVVFLVLKDILMIDASHHNMEYPCARWFTRLSGHFSTSGAMLLSSFILSNLV